MEMVVVHWRDPYHILDDYSFTDFAELPATDPIVSVGHLAYRDEHKIVLATDWLPEAEGVKSPWSEADPRYRSVLVVPMQLVERIANLREA